MDIIQHISKRLSSRPNQEAGYSTVEMLVAFTVFSISLTGISAVAFSNQSVSIDTEMSSEALSYAQKEIESQRAKAKNDFTNIVSDATVVSLDSFYSKQNTVANLSQCQKNIKTNVLWAVSGRPNQNVTLTTQVADVQEMISLGGTCSSVSNSNQLTCPAIVSVQSLSGGISSGSAVKGLDVINKIAYLAVNPANSAQSDFYIIDVRYGSPYISFEVRSESGGLNAVDAAYNSTNDSTYAFGVGNYDSTAGKKGQVQVFNVSDPTMTEPKPYELPNNIGAGLSVFYRKNILTNQELLYIGTEYNSNVSGGEFYIVDITDKGSPQSLNSGFKVGGSVNKIYVKNGYAYLATNLPNKELVVLDVSNPASISQVGSGFDASGSGAGKSLFVMGINTFLTRQTGGNEFFSLNTSNPASVSLLDSENIGSNTNDLVVSGNYAYTGSDSGAYNFQVWNISNPASIALCPSTSLRSFAAPVTGVVSDSGLVFVSLGSNEALKIIGF